MSALLSHVREAHRVESAWREACECWATMTIQERAFACQMAGVPTEAAAHDALPMSYAGALLDHLTD